MATTTVVEAEVQGTTALSTYATLYATAAGASAVFSTIGVCNTSASAVTVRVAVMGTAGTPAAVNWRVYDAVVAGNDVVALTIGLTMGASRFMRVSSSANTVTFFAGVAVTV